MNKICTTIEQSKKLSELGIDTSTADMFWDMAEPDKRRKPLVGPISDYYDMENWVVPAWSLSALLELIPSNVFLYLKLVKWDESYYIEHREMLCDNPIDAVFEMVCWLLENKKI